MAKKILVVDDAAFMRMAIKRLFPEYDVLEAGGAAEAVRLYKEHTPDVVTMDITMPDIDGVTAVNMIKEVDPAAKICMISAMGQTEMVMRAIQAGAADFIVKPFKDEAVRGKIMRILGDA